MRSKTFGPPNFIPSPGAVCAHLEQTEALAHRLRILLRVAQEIQISAGGKSTHADTGGDHAA